MIFAGDVAIPNTNIKLVIPNEIREKSWFVNLEGSLIDENTVESTLCEKKVFNNEEAIKSLRDILSIKVCSLANNHIEDCSKVGETMSRLNIMGMLHVGAGLNLKEAEQAIEIKEEGRNLLILSFGWDVIKCPFAKKNKSGVNPYSRDHVIKTVKNNLLEDSKLIVFFHWGYELEAYPLPYDRKLAHDLIDMGVSAVIGCHAHRVQQIEMYKGRPIVYGLGNFIFPHKAYWNGRLKFPKFTQRELAFEVTEKDVFIAHWFEYSVNENKLSYVWSETITPESGGYEGRAVYTGYTDKEYDIFFRVNRYHKKMIPIYYSHESAAMYAIKSVFVKYRGHLIDMMVKLNIKAKKK